MGGGGGFALPEFVRTQVRLLNSYILRHCGPRAYRFLAPKSITDLKRFNEPPQFVAAQAYVALYVIADALKRA